MMLFHLSGQSTKGSQRPSPSQPSNTPLHFRCGGALLIAFVALLAGNSAVAADTLSPEAQQEWIRYTLPLPQEIAIPRSITLRPDSIGLTTTDMHTDALKQAEKELRTFFETSAGVKLDGSGFMIYVGLWEDLKHLPDLKAIDGHRLSEPQYSDQAYLIRPVGKRGLVIAGGGSAGVYYGVQTLMQLLSRDVDTNRVRMPLTVITDWPAFDSRGAWNTHFQTPGFIAWQAGLKLNFTHKSMDIILDKEHIGTAACESLPLELMNNATRHGFTLMPHSPHFDYWYRYGRDTIYPDLVGKGGTAGNPARYGRNAVAKHEIARAPCPTNPMLAELTEAWIRSAASQGATEVSLWLTEHSIYGENKGGYCSCERCQATGKHQQTLEAEACIQAIRGARQQYPDLEARIFFCFKGNPDREASANALAMLPPDIKAEKVYGTNDAFDTFAENGRWLATYRGAPYIYFPAAVCRFSYATFVRNRLQHYAEHSYAGLYTLGSVEPDPLEPSQLDGNRTNGFESFEYSALAEWSWNPGGRTVDEFRSAWIRREGYELPHQAEEVLNTVASATAMLLEHFGNRKHRISSSWRTVRHVPDALRKGDRLTPYDLPTLTEHVERLRQAEALARSFSIPNLALETRFLRTLLQVHVALAQLSNAVAASGDETRRAEDTEQQLTARHNSLVTAINHHVAAGARRLALWKVTSREAEAQLTDSEKHAWERVMRRIDRAVHGLHN